MITRKIPWAKLVDRPRAYCSRALYLALLPKFASRTLLSIFHRHFHV